MTNVYPWSILGGERERSLSGGPVNIVHSKYITENDG